MNSMDCPFNPRPKKCDLELQLDMLNVALHEAEENSNSLLNECRQLSVYCQLLEDILESNNIPLPYRY